MSSILAQFVMQRTSQDFMVEGKLVTFCFKRMVEYTPRGVPSIRNLSMKNEQLIASHLPLNLFIYLLYVQSMIIFTTITLMPKVSLIHYELTTSPFCMFVETSMFL